MQNLDEFADDVQLPLHHSDVESSAEKKKDKQSSTFHTNGLGDEGPFLLQSV